MEVISDNYSNTNRIVDVYFFPQYPSFASLKIREEGFNTLTIRFNPDKKEDFLFFDQLRSAVERVGKFMRP